MINGLNRPAHYDISRSSRFSKRAAAFHIAQKVVQAVCLAALLLRAVGMPERVQDLCSQGLIARHHAHHQ